MKKIVSSLLILLLLAAVATGLVLYFPQWNPWHPAKSTTPASANPVIEYAQMADSLDALDLLIRNEADPRMLQLHQSRQRYFRERATALRNVIDTNIAHNTPTSPASPVSESDELRELMRSVGGVVAAVAGLLLVFVLAIWFLMRRRTPKTKRVAKPDPDATLDGARFRAPKGGFGDPDLTRIEDAPRARAKQTMDPDATIDLPDTRTIEIPRATIQTAKTSGTRERITRITKAIKGLAEALATLKPPQAADTALDRAKTKTRAKSQNTMDPTQSNTAIGDDPLPPRPEAMEPSRFDKEREEKEDILKLARRGYTSSEISRRLRVPQDRVEMVIRLQRDMG